MKHILLIPNSNAATERLFSLLRHVYTEQRKSLALDKINSILSIKVNKTSSLPTFDFDLAVRKMQTGYYALQRVT